MKVVLLAPESKDRARIAEWLGARGYAVTAAETASAALDALPQEPAFAVADLAARQESVRFLRCLMSQNRSAWVIALGDRRDPANTAEALRLGVVDVVPRPVREAELLAALANAREFAGLAGRRPPPIVEAPGETIFTISPRMREVHDIARRVAASRCPILLVGERGTGRETLARAIHRYGPSRECEFVKIVAGPDCAGGIEEALGRHDARSGTLYVDEAALLPDAAQARLETALAATSGGRDQDANGARSFRLIAGAEPRLDALVERRAFRRALFEALSVVRLDLPTLRERPQDVPLLALMFMKDACARHDVSAKTFSRSALALLSSLPWRGNAAELCGLVERLALMVPRGVVLQEDVLQHVRFDDAQARGGSGGTLREARREFEREFIASTLQRHQWRIEAAAGELGIERTNLYRKMKQLSISRGDTRLGRFCNSRF